MEFLDARRLTGPSILFDRHGTILDVACTTAEAERLIPVWEKHVRRMLAEIGWTDCEFASVILKGGVSMAFTAADFSAPVATTITLRALRIVPRPIVIAELGCSSLPAKKRRLASRVAGVRHTILVRESTGDPGSLKATCPLPPSPRSSRSNPPNASIRWS